MKRIKNIIFSIIFLSSYSVFSQSTTESVEGLSFEERLFYGGGFGLNFGTNMMVELSPQVGYRVTSRLSSGLGVTFKYLSYRDYNYTRHETSIYGGKMFANYMITENIFPHAEVEILSLEKKYFDFLNNFPSEGRFWSQGVFVGAGYYMPMGEKSGFYTLILYNMNESSNSAYDSPWVFRMGVCF